MKLCVLFEPRISIRFGHVRRLFDALSKTVEDIYHLMESFLIDWNGKYKCVDKCTNEWTAKNTKFCTHRLFALRCRDLPSACDNRKRERNNILRWQSPNSALRTIFDFKRVLFTFQFDFPVKNSKRNTAKQHKTTQRRNHFVIFSLRFT